MANMSGPDVFALPPSGHTYSYPGQVCTFAKLRLNLNYQIEPEIKICNWSYLSLFSPPCQMDDTNQLSYRDSTNEDCDLLLATGTVHWEWFYGWHAAFAHYFPKYLQTSGDTDSSCIRSFFATNVPYNFPTDVVWGDFYRALEDKVLAGKKKM